jgi:hypothetical protein
MSASYDTPMYGTLVSDVDASDTSTSSLHASNSNVLQRTGAECSRVCVKREERGVCVCVCTHDMSLDVC